MSVMPPASALARDDDDARDEEDRSADEDVEPDLLLVLLAGGDADGQLVALRRVQVEGRRIVEVGADDAVLVGPGDARVAWRLADELPRRIGRRTALHVDLGGRVDVDLDRPLGRRGRGGGRGRSLSGR